MNILRWIGILLIVAGVLSFVYQGITYTTREKVVDLGPVEASVEKKKTIPFHPLVSGVALVAGIALIVGPRGKTSSA
jgi:hypothetical protein